MSSSPNLLNTILTEVLGTWWLKTSSLRCSFFTGNYFVSVGLWANSCGVERNLPAVSLYPVPFSHLLSPHPPPSQSLQGSVTEVLAQSRGGGGGGSPHFITTLKTGKCSQQKREDREERGGVTSIHKSSRMPTCAELVPPAWEGRQTVVVIQAGSGSPATDIYNNAPCKSRSLPPEFHRFIF